MNMKACITFATSVVAVLYLIGVPAYSQGKGPGHVPSGSQDHNQGADHSQHPNAISSDHSKSENWETRLNERFDNDTKFHARMQSLLPQGMDLKTAESGFENRGQLIAALHLSQNLNIPFDQLKAKMTGVSVNAAGQTTTSTPMSLGKAIHELRPDLTQGQANQQVQRAEKQTKETERSNATS
jgi:hypothetical protein